MQKKVKNDTKLQDPLVHYYTYIDALLFTDLSTNVGTGIEVHWSNEVDKTTETAAITYSFCRLAKNVAGTEVGDDAWKSQISMACH